MNNSVDKLYNLINVAINHRYVKEDQEVLFSRIREELEKILCDVDHTYDNHQSNKPNLGDLLTECIENNNSKDDNNLGDERDNHQLNKPSLGDLLTECIENNSEDNNDLIDDYDSCKPFDKLMWFGGGKLHIEGEPDDSNIFKDMLRDFGIRI